MPTLPLFITVSRQSPLFQKPIWPVPYPPTKRSSVIHRPPSLLSDRSRPLTIKSTEAPPPPTTCSLAAGAGVPTPTLPELCTTNRPLTTPGASIPNAPFPPKLKYAAPSTPPSTLSMLPAPICSGCDGWVVPMPTSPLGSTASRQAPPFQNPILLVSNPPTNRSSATQRPPSLLSDRSRPLTTRSTLPPPPPMTCSRAFGVVVPIPTLPVNQSRNILVVPTGSTLCDLMCRPFGEAIRSSYRREYP